MAHSDHEMDDDMAKMSSLERKRFIDDLIKHVEHDNLRLLQKMRQRLDRVGVEVPTLEVRYKNLKVEVACKVIHGKPIPTLWNSFKRFFPDLFNLPRLFSEQTKITIIDDVSGIIKPGRMTLLLGPPGCGKTTLLKALSGNLSKSVNITGEVTYNKYKLDEFIPQKTCVYISQNDLQIPELTVRETLDFSASCQGVGSQADILLEVRKRENEAGIVPDPNIDTYMKAISANGQKTTLQTDYILKILGLDICADTLVGNAMKRGISGGQKKRLTTGELIVGSAKALFMDEISNGLDSSTTYQIITCLQQLAHITDSTIFIALLQPAPEIFDLFDDIVLMSEGKIVYHGPRDNILEFFEDCGFKCPKRKGVADFLQEVLSEKDQAQYWYRYDESYSYISSDIFTRKYRDSLFGEKHRQELSIPFTKPEINGSAISFQKYSLSKWALFRACMSREFLLMRRNSFVYVFKGFQIFITASVTMTVFLRTGMEVDETNANYYLSALFFGLMILFVDGMPELTMTVAKLPMFYKQRDTYLYPAWAFAIPTTILKIPISLFEAFIWTSLTYYVIGYSPEPGRFFRQLILLFAVHLTATSMFHFLASVFRTMLASLIAATSMIQIFLLFSGFIIPTSYMPIWLKWGTWISPLTYGEIGIALNEFLSPRWQKALLSNNKTIGQETLGSIGLQYNGYFFWISLGALFCLTILFNVGFALALTFLNPPGSSAIISSEKLAKIEENNNVCDKKPARTKSNRTVPETVKNPHEGRMVLPFEPMTISFEDVQYYVDTPLAMRKRGFTEKKIQLLCDISGAFRPGVLTALMGVSGAGKTTLLDVLSGRKTSGTVEGDIRIGGYIKIQKTFARISGYCEQTDVHSPQLTVEESIIFSAWLRLDPQIHKQTKLEFAAEVLETIELNEIKDSLVGLPGVSGLSTEQRKRLTIAVELVANSSIIFMDEPTTGLDARSAAIVMRAVKNVANTGRTIVCTIHQPSIDIFEAFDELMLLKSGGHIIYFGPLGHHSSSVIKYFEDILGVQKIRDNSNPATWMLEVTSTSAESELGVDLIQVYKNSVLCQYNTDLVKRLRTPLPGCKEIYFPTQFSQNGWGQFKCCLWKQYLSYWRSPSYNLRRILFLFIFSFVLGILFWDHGTKLQDQQGLFTIFGSMFSSAILTGLNNCASVIPYVSTERSVLYREKFAGMYSPWAYALAQVIIEVPYVLAQTVGFVIITYPMIGFYWSAYKVAWYFYAMFCTLLYYTYMGMLLVAITPSFPIAATLQSAFYTMFNLFSGFFVPQLQIPKWWVWMYYATPTSWTMNAMLTSQYGDVDKKILVLEKNTKVAVFIKDHYGFDHDWLPFVALALLLYPIVFAFIFAYCIGKLNFQRR